MHPRKKSLANARTAWPWLAIVVSIAIGLGAGCDETSTEPEGDPSNEGKVPAFTLVDRNPNSPTHEQPISPSDYDGEISCWYFASAT